MRELLLIGIGTGNPDHLTRAGEAAIRAADAILIPRKGADKADLAELRIDICRAVLDGDLSGLVEFDVPVRDTGGEYREGVEDWHDKIAQSWAAACPVGAECVALLVWGDPSLYDSTLRIAARLEPRPKVRVVPGITALQALTAAHAIPLNDINAPVVITTGRQLRETGWPSAADTVAVLLDGECSFRNLDPKGVTIWWGAYLGMENEVLRSGALVDLAADILEVRSKARANHGWIMDTYLLRREQPAN